MNGTKTMFWQDSWGEIVQKYIKKELIICLINYRSVSAEKFDQILQERSLQNEPL
jgi:hypothetical protein